MDPVSAVSAGGRGLISIEEFNRLNDELMQLKAEKYEAVARERRLTEQLNELQKQQQPKKEFLGGVFKKKTTPSALEAPAAGPSELELLQRKVSSLEAEIALHKSTKDQLSRDLDAARTDTEDQRSTFKRSLQSLSEKNAELQARLLQAGSGDAPCAAQADAAADAPASSPVVASVSPTISSTASLAV